MNILFIIIELHKMLGK